MEKRGAIIEIIIKLGLAILAFIAIIYVALDLVSMTSLFKVMKLNEVEIEDAIFKTNLYPIYKNIGIVDNVDGNIVSLTIVSFAKTIGAIPLVYLFVSIGLLITYFIFIRWNLILSNIKMIGFLALTYLFKYILFGIQFLLFYKDDTRTLAISIFTGTILYIIVSLVEMFILSLFIYKFVISLKKDSIYIKNLD